MNLTLSVVITVYNEEDNIAPLTEALESALKDIDHEVIYVDDGSSDTTVAKIHEHAYDRVVLVDLLKNVGQSAAMSAGIEAARGDYIVTMDGDLQNDPSDIPHMLEKAQLEGYDVVAGIRANRQDNAVLRKAPSRLANRMIRWITGVKLHDYGCSLRVYRQFIAKNLNLYGELHRFIPVLAQMQGARMTEVPVKHHARIHGTSKYGLGRTTRVMSDLILVTFMQRYMQRPMHIFGLLGLSCLMIGLLICFYLVLVKCTGHDIGGRPLLMLGVLFIIGGMQFLTIGIVAEIGMRTYYESQNKTPYVVKNLVRFTDEQMANGEVVDKES